MHSGHPGSRRDQNNQDQDNQDQDLGFRTTRIKTTRVIINTTRLIFSMAPSGSERLRAARRPEPGERLYMICVGAGFECGPREHDAFSRTSADRDMLIRTWWTYSPSRSGSGFTLHTRRIPYHSL